MKKGKAYLINLPEKISIDNIANFYNEKIIII